MNTPEQIYQDVQDFPEALALEVLHFVEFLKFKHQSVSHLELEQKIQQILNNLPPPFNELNQKTCSQASY
jgi:hypothetical protein